MSTPSFPYSTLGSPIASGYKITRNATRGRVDTTCGIPVQHTRTSGSIFEIDATWSLGLSQYAVFADWYRTDVKDGTIEFTIDGMVLNGDQTTITARFAKSYKETDNGYGGRNVSVTLETSDADYISEATLDAALPAEPHTDAVTWPASLFGGVLQDWSESPTSNDFRGDVTGFALDYRKRKSNLVLTVADISFSMSNDAKKLFDAWYHYKLIDGAGWFWLWCEIRGVWKYAKVRFVDEVSMSYRSVSRWDVTGTIETVDAQYWDLSDCQDLVPHNNETKPTITQQSEGGAYLAGETVNLFVVASGTQPITYQWYLDGEPISGATSAEYSFTMSEAYEGSYTCVASNALGSDTSDSMDLVYGIGALVSFQTDKNLVTTQDGTLTSWRDVGDSMWLAKLYSGNGAPKLIIEDSLNGITPLKYSEDFMGTYTYYGFPSSSFVGNAIRSICILCHVVDAAGPYIGGTDTKTVLITFESGGTYSGIFAQSSSSVPNFTMVTDNTETVTSVASESAGWCLLSYVHDGVHSRLYNGTQMIAELETSINTPSNPYLLVGGSETKSYIAIDAINDVRIMEMHVFTSDISDELTGIIGFLNAKYGLSLT